MKYSTHFCLMRPTPRANSHSMLYCIPPSNTACSPEAASSHACRVEIRTAGSKYKGGVMNWDQIQGKWKQSAGVIREKWGKLTDDDLTVIAGKKDQLVGKIQERYGVAKDAAEKQVDEFTRNYRPSDPSSDRQTETKDNPPPP